MATAIEAIDVTKRYGAHRPALARVSLTVGAGDFVAIVGGSGSGKTTLLQLVNRLAEPTSGTLRVNGADVLQSDPIALRRGIGYVFQEIGLFPHMTVADNISITPRLLQWDAPRIAKRVIELLTLVRLDPDVRTRWPHELSGGQRQRVGVARAIAASPSIMLMDEPFAALDPVTRDALGQDYRAIHKKLGLTTVMVTHDMLEALSLADRILVLRDGSLIADGTPSDLLSDDHDAVRELMQMPLRTAERVSRLLPREPHYETH